MSRGSNDDFADNVRRLYYLTTSDNECERPERYHRDVRRVAYGLAALKKALDRYSEEDSNGIFMPEDVFREKVLRAEVFDAHNLLDLECNGFVANGISDALEILEALTNGHDHPVWRLLAGIRTGRFRTQKAPPNKIEILRRRSVVGFVRAVQKCANVSQAEAIRKVI